MFAVGRFLPLARAISQQPVFSAERRSVRDKAIPFTCKNARGGRHYPLEATTPEDYCCSLRYSIVETMWQVAIHTKHWTQLKIVNQFQTTSTIQPKGVHRLALYTCDETHTITVYRSCAKRRRHHDRDNNCNRPDIRQVNKTTAAAANVQPPFSFSCLVEVEDFLEGCHR